MIERSSGYAPPVPITPPAVRSCGAGAAPNPGRDGQRFSRRCARRPARSPDGERARVARPAPWRASPCACPRMREVERDFAAEGARAIDAIAPGGAVVVLATGRGPESMAHRRRHARARRRSSAGGSPGRRSSVAARSRSRSSSARGCRRTCARSRAAHDPRAARRAGRGRRARSRRRLRSRRRGQPRRSRRARGSRRTRRRGTPVRVGAARGRRASRGPRRDASSRARSTRWRSRPRCRRGTSSTSRIRWAPAPRSRTRCEARVVVAAVGPTCARALEELGAPPHVMPEPSKMGPLVLALASHFGRKAQSGDPRPPR